MSGLIGLSNIHSLGGGGILLNFHLNFKTEIVSCACTNTMHKLLNGHICKLKVSDSIKDMHSWSLMSQSIPATYYPPPPPPGNPQASEQIWCPGCMYLTKRPTNARWQFNSIIFYFLIFSMDKCIFCLQISPIH